MTDIIKEKRKMMVVIFVKPPQPDRINRIIKVYHHLKDIVYLHLKEEVQYLSGVLVTQQESSIAEDIHRKISVHQLIPQINAMELLTTVSTQLERNKAGTTEDKNVMMHVKIDVIMKTVLEI